MAKATEVCSRAYLLELSEAEANTLRTLLHYVGGCGEQSRRKHADSIRRALIGANASMAEADTHDVMPRAHIYFQGGVL